MELDTLDGEPIDVYANDTLIGRGEVVVVGEQLVLELLKSPLPTTGSRVLADDWWKGGADHGCF